MSTKHTPGPWKAIRNEVWVAKRRICASVSAGESLSIGAAFDRSCANARLIAAAPELLEALQRIAERCTTDDGSYLVASVGDTARAAIAKATGEQA